MTFSSGIAGEHTMMIAGEGANPKRANLLNVAKNLDIESKKALAIIDQIQTLFWS